MKCFAWISEWHITPLLSNDVWLLILGRRNKATCESDLFLRAGVGVVVVAESRPSEESRQDLTMWCFRLEPYNVCLRPRTSAQSLQTIPLRQVFSTLFYSQPIFLPVNVNTLIVLWYFYKYFTWNAVCVLYCVLCKRDVSNKFHSERPCRAIRNGCLFEWLFTRRICRLLDSLSGMEGRKEVDSGGKRGKTNSFFFSSKQCFTRSVFQRMEYTRADGRRKWEREEEGEEKKQRLTNRWWWMEIEPTVSAARWADAAVQSDAAEEGGGGALSPVCPAGRRVCDGTTPAVSPEPSSQRPGSYCFSPFGCPAKGMEETDTFTGDTAITASHLTHMRQRVCWDKHTLFRLFGRLCWWTMGSCKCLPPCFLLSSPFWSPFFGCSLGLWGCCEVTRLNQFK